MARVVRITSSLPVEGPEQRNPLPHPDRQPPQEQGDREPTAQRPERGRGEVPERRMPARREVLEVLQNAGV